MVTATTRVPPRVDVRVTRHPDRPQAGLGGAEVAAQVERLRGVGGGGADLRAGRVAQPCGDTVGQRVETVPSIRHWARPVRNSTRPGVIWSTTGGAAATTVIVTESVCGPPGPVTVSSKVSTEPAAGR